MLYHVALDGSAGPDIELDDEPVPEQIIEWEGIVARVYVVMDSADGSKVINASRIG